jgi:hypothetical protein
MSIILENKPEHAAWHDLESIFWVLIWFVVRNVAGVKLVVKDEEQSCPPAQILDIIFRDPGTSSAIQDINQSRRNFLMRDALIMPCPALQDTVSSIQIWLRNLYGALDALEILEREFLTLVGHLKPGAMELQKQRKFASAKGNDDLKDLIKTMLYDVESFRNIAAGISTWMTRCNDLEDGMKFQYGRLSKNGFGFPTHLDLRSIFQVVLNDKNSASCALVPFRQAYSHGGGHLNMDEPNQSIQPGISRSIKSHSSASRKRPATDALKIPEGKHLMYDCLTISLISF